jgi:YhcH/YjgK/YiaL family protein
VDYLRSTNLTALEPRKHAIDGDRLFVLINHEQGRGREESRLESHRRYIDIQYVFDGEEEFGWRHLSDCRQVDEAYDDARDLAFYADRPQTWIRVPAGSFVVFYPQDAHAPLASTQRVSKAVVKVAVELR